MNNSVIYIIRITFFCLSISLFTILDAQVFYDNNSECDGAGVGTNNFLSITDFSVPANNNAVLIVLVRSSESMTATAVTFNSQSLARFSTVVSYANARAEIWYISLGNVAAPITSDIVVSWTGNNLYRFVTAASFHNVDQASPLSNLVSNGFPIGSTTSSVNVAGNIGDMVIESISSIGDLANPPVFTSTGSQTPTSSCTTTPLSSFRQSAAYKEQTGGGTTLSWTISSISLTTDNGIQMAANIKTNSILPLDLVHFSGLRRDNYHILSWITANEHNSDHFEVQQRSDTGEFVPIGDIEATGDTHQEVSYSFSNHYPFAITSYYRLKMVDNDGSYKFSPVIAIENQTGSSPVVVYPNPTKTNVNINTSNPNRTTRLFNLQGIKLFESTVAPELLDMNLYPAGLYLLQIGEETMKVKKE